MGTTKRGQISFKYQAVLDRPTDTKIFKRGMDAYRVLSSGLVSGGRLMMKLCNFAMLPATHS
jgi:hypothetical protein